MRVGFGFDVHAFTKDRKLVLGGVEIPFDKGLLGHSDADVLFHAVMDALLGAAALGDIGKLFPDSDPAYKNISSGLLLQKVGQHLATHHFTIGNIDCVVVAQQPKLAPYIPQMRQTTAILLGMDVEDISIKATTTEHLGFEGRSEGISCYAVCTIEKQ